jgi:hypothetical protein
VDAFPGLSDGSLNAYLGFLYDGLSGYVIVGELQHKDKDTSWMNHTAFNWPQERDDIQAHIALRGRDHEVYIAPAVFNAPVARKESFKTSNVCWAEYDNPEAYTPGDYKPSLRIRSSLGKEHHYYRLQVPVTNISDLETANRAIAYATGADKSGWDATQLLRPIRSFNHKYDTPSEVTVLEVPAIFPHALTDLIGAFQAPAQVAEIELPKILPEAPDVLLKYRFSDEAARMMKLDSLPPNKRSEGIMAFAFALAEMGMENAEIFVLLAHKDKKWGKFFKREDRVQRYLDIVRVAKEKHPKALAEGEIDPEVPPPGTNLLILGWRSLQEYEADFDWVVENMWAENTMNILFGQSGIGKTQVSMRFAMSMALGREEFLGFKIPKKRKVTMLSLEMGIHGVKYFQTQMAKGLTEEEANELEENFQIIPVGNPIDLSTPYGQDSIRYLLDQTQPDVLMVDSMGSAVPGELAKEDPLARMLAFNDRINGSGVATWFISHPRKQSAEASASRRPTLNDLYGGFQQHGRARGVYAIHQGKASLELLALKQTFAASSDEPIHIKRVDGLDFQVMAQSELIEVKQATVKTPPVAKQKADPTEPLGTI